jgi:long-subunit fatty acid transport protein
LPDADRNGFSLGGTWRSGSWTVDAASWFILGGSRSTAGVNRDSYEGTYKSRVFTLGVFLGYAF